MKCNKKKMYAVGGTVPKKGWVQSGKAPVDTGNTNKKEISNKELLERMTHQKALAALKKSGVGTITSDSTKVVRMDGSGKSEILDNNYEKTIALAKQTGVYDLARAEAVKDFRNRK